MPQNTPAACSDCGGFARVAIAIGNRRQDGSRTLLFVECRGCEGTGTENVATRPAQLVMVGR